MQFSTSFIALYLAISTAAALPVPEAGNDPAPATGTAPTADINHDGDIFLTPAERAKFEGEYASTSSKQDASNQDPNKQKLSARNWHYDGYKHGYHKWHGKKWKRDGLDQAVNDEDVYATLAARGELGAENDRAATYPALAARNWRWNWGWHRGRGWGWWGHYWKRAELDQEHGIQQRGVPSNYEAETDKLPISDRELEGYENKAREQELAARAEDDQESAGIDAGASVGVVADTDVTPDAEEVDDKNNNNN